MTPVQKLNKLVSDTYEEFRCFDKVAIKLGLSVRECKTRRGNYLSGRSEKMRATERAAKDKIWRDAHDKIKLEPIVNGLKPVSFAENYNFRKNPSWVW